MSWSTRTFRSLLLGLVYLAAAGLSVAFTRYGGVNASLWFASGILIAVLGTAPYDRWPRKIGACAVASALATGLWGMGWDVALPLAVAKMGEAAVGAALFKKIDNRRTPQFDTFAWFWRLVVAVGVIAPLLSAIGLALVAWHLGKPVIPIFLSTWVSNGLGNVVIAPLVLPLASATERRATLANIRLRGAKLVLPQLGVLLVAAAAFVQPQISFLFVPVIPVILTTIAMGRESAVLGVIIIVGVGAGMTAVGLGPIATAVDDPGGRLLMVQGFFAATVLTLLPVSADLHAKRQLVNELRRSEERFRLLAEQSSDIIVSLDRSGRIYYISPAVQRLCGYEPAALFGHFPVEMIDEQFHADVVAANKAMMDHPGQNRTVQWQGRLLGGELRWFETNGQALVGPGGTVEGTLSIIRDISEHKKLEAALTEAAFTDTLTGLPNRRAFRRALDERGGPAAVQDCLAIFDIDHFKRVNDRHGHDGGDALLQHLGAIARSAVRERDLVARLGGEEFGLFLPDCTIEQALMTCDRLRRCLEDAVVVHRGAHIRATISGGVSRIDERGIDYAMSVADRALYEAKAGGRNQLALAA